MIIMRNKIFIYLMLIMSVCLVACEKKADQKATTQVKTITATLRAVPTELFYSGTISPIEVQTITSPADGTVTKLNFKYGEIVLAGKLLMTISSTKLQQDYRTALTDFLKAKEDYKNTTVNFQGTQELYTAQIISQQEYLSEKEQFDSTELAFVNAKENLEQTLKGIPGVPKQIELENLSLDDFSVISKTLQTHYDNVQIVAPTSGIALFPQKNGNSSDGSSDGSSSSSNGKIHVGSQVKQGQRLVDIGDLLGISATIQVSELVVNKIKPGQAVTITIDALPNTILSGVVTSVGAQAQTSAGSQGTLANFPVVVQVNKITPQQSNLIRVGMSIKIQISLPNPPQIIIPINAVSQQNGKTMVNILDASGKPSPVVVQTGATTLTDVVVTQGLKPGDQVVVP